MDYKTLVAQNFDFLKLEFDFRSLKNGIGYEKDDLELEFHCGNGQVDINFFVRKDNDIFKPFVSRSFDLHNVLRQVSADKMEPYPNAISGRLTECSNINLHLQYYAKMLREHSEGILHGDLTVFESTHKYRRERAKKAR